MRKGTKRDKTTTIYTGVFWNTMLQKFHATITCEGVKYLCGAFDTPLEAVKARDRKIMALNLNIPLQIYKKVEKKEPIKQTV